MNEMNTFRVMIILASVILVSIITLALLTNLDVIHGMSIQEMNQTTTAASADFSKEIEQRLSNFTSELVPH